MTGNRAFLLSAVLVLPVGCAGARDPAGTPGAPPATVTWAIQEDPLAVRLSSGGRPLVTFASAGRSAFYLYDQDTGDRVDLTGPVETLLEGGRTTLGLRTRDGRKASVTLEPGPEGSARVAFEAGALKPSERPSADLGVDPTEGFYGLMERVVQGHQDESWAPGTKQGLDLRGQTIELVVLPTVSLYSPFFVSSAGYGVLVDSDWPGVYDMGATAPGVVSIRYEGPDLPFVVFPGPGPAAAQARYARAVGTTILPPEWAFGPWRWRDDHVHMPAYYDGTPATAPYNSQVVEDVLMMEALGIPCSVYWVDRPWGPGDFGYDDLEWDTTRFPRPVDMIDWLAGRDIRFLLWIVDWAVGPKMLPEAESRGYLVGAEWPSQPNARLIDLTLPAAVEWWQDALVERIGDGLAGFKCDRGEEKEPDGIVLTGQYADGTSFREGRNANPRWYAAAVHGALERAAPEGGYVSIFRAGWRGSQQHTVFWGGDTASGPWGLRSAIIAMQRAAAMHFPIWGSDTCG
ncbi:MAG: hypothetical protein FJ087_03095 [Deltaproteobacteria bacterium]|nr:hypothetical protein [Deltaproteobacteria bacterium]